MRERNKTVPLYFTEIGNKFHPLQKEKHMQSNVYNEKEILNFTISLVHINLWSPS